MLYVNRTEWRWLNPGYGSVTLRSNAVGGAASFDSFGQAWVTLFEISTTEMWVVPAWASSDAVGVGRQPVRGSYDVITLAFVAFGKRAHLHLQLCLLLPCLLLTTVFLMFYFVLQLFVAALINTYLDSSEE